MAMCFPMGLMHMKLSHSSLVLCCVVVVPMMSAWEELCPPGLHRISVFVLLSSD